MGSLGFFFEYGELPEGYEDQSYKTGFGSTIPMNCDDSAFDLTKAKKIKKAKKPSKGFNTK